MPKNDEEKGELYNKLGRPETSEGYELAVPQGYEEYYPAEMLKSFKDTGHKLGLNAEQMQGLVEWQKGSVDYQYNQSMISGEAVGVSTAEALKEEFGAEYDKNMRSAQRALRVYGNRAIQDKLADPRYGNDPDLIRMLAAAGKDITEDSAQGTANNSLVMSPLDAKMRIEQINSDKNHPYWNTKDPSHATAQEEMRQMFDKAYNT